MSAIVDTAASAAAAPGGPAAARPPARPAAAAAASAAADSATRELQAADCATRSCSSSSCGISSSSSSSCRSISGPRWCLSDGGNGGPDPRQLAEAAGVPTEGRHVSAARAPAAAAAAAAAAAGHAVPLGWRQTGATAPCPPQGRWRLQWLRQQRWRRRSHMHCGIGACCLQRVGCSVVTGWCTACPRDPGGGGARASRWCWSSPAGGSVQVVRLRCRSCG